MSSNGYKCPYSLEEDPISKALDKCKEHPIIKLIKAKNNSQVFNFSQINMKSKNLSKVLTWKKSAQNDDIKTNILKKNADFFAKYTCDDINDSIQFVFQNFPMNWNKRTSYINIRKSQSFLRKIINLSMAANM